MKGVFFIKNRINAMNINYSDVNISSYKKSQSQIEFKTDSATELFTTKKENMLNLFILLVPISTLLAPMIWSFYNGYDFTKNIIIISITCILGMIAEYKIITSLDSPTNIGKVKMTFSSNNLTIDSQKRGKITINLYNIRTIYIDSDESDSDSKSTYTVIFDIFPINLGALRCVSVIENC